MFLNIVCLCAAAVCVLGAPSTDVVPLKRQQPTVIPIVEQSEEIEANGTFKFSYETGNGIKREEISFDKVLPKTRSGISSNETEDDNNEIHVQQGSYSYTAPDGTVITVRYIADENGFRPIGDHLPKPPSILVGASSSRVSGRRSKTVDSDAGSSAPTSTFAAAPVVVADVPLVPASSVAKAPESPELESRIADTSFVQASAPESVPVSNELNAQESSTTPETPSTTEILSTAEPSASTTESASGTTESVAASEVTSTEQPTTVTAALISEASSEPSTAEEPASTVAASTVNVTPESISSLDAATEAATTASA